MEYAPKQKQNSLKLKKSVKIGSLLVVIVLLAGGIWWYQQRQSKPHVKEAVFTFSYGTPLPTNSSEYLTYGKRYEDITFPEVDFSMTEIGEYEVAVTFAQEYFQLKIRIVDDIPPTISFIDKEQVELISYQGSVKADSLFTVQDDSEVTVTTTPDLSTITNGKQEICVNAKDTYENESKACKEFDITLAEVALANVPSADSVQALVEQYMKEKNLTKSTFGFYYYSPSDGETYVFNGDSTITAASIIKVPLNMLYEDRYQDGTFQPSDTIVLAASDIEEGEGDTLIDYRIGQSIPYAYLQEQCIENSDNTATNMLVKGLGGFSTFRKLLTQYSDIEYPANFYTQNVVTMNYMLDVMTKLYEEQEHYSNLIAHMKKASVGDYLQKSTDVFQIAQKYGLYDGNLHATGIVYTPQPYIVGIYTMNRSDGDRIIPELNQWLLAYQLQK